MKNMQQSASQDRPRELGAAFEAYLRRRRKLGDRTIRTYGYNGARMVAFFKEHGAETIDDITVELAEAWVSWLLKEGRSDGSARAA